MNVVIKIAVAFVLTAVTVIPSFHETPTASLSLMSISGSAGSLAE